jgi:hypothetical protein
VPPSADGYFVIIFEIVFVKIENSKVMLLISIGILQSKFLYSAQQQLNKRKLASSNLKRE